MSETADCGTPLSATWWVINGAELSSALHRVAEGADPDLAYAELYANSTRGGGQ